MWPNIYQEGGKIKYEHFKPIFQFQFVVQMKNDRVVAHNFIIQFLNLRKIKNWTFHTHFSIFIFSSN